jgi:ATP-dependent Clp protease ATP-binding subunit ClpA
VLRDLEIDLEALSEEVKALVGRGKSAPSGHIPFTPPAKKSLELSLRESLQLGHDYIGTEHLLLGILHQGEGPAAEVLVQRGADLDTVRGRVAEILAKNKGRRKSTAIAAAPLNEILVQLQIVSERLAAIEAKLGIEEPAARVEVRRISHEIAKLRRAKESAIDEQDFKRAASLREAEKELLRRRKEAENATMEDPPAATQ